MKMNDENVAKIAALTEATTALDEIQKRYEWFVEMNDKVRLLMDDATKGRTCISETNRLYKENKELYEYLDKLDITQNSIVHELEQILIDIGGNGMDLEHLAEGLLAQENEEKSLTKDGVVIKFPNSKTLH